jgi:hypothetical protein
MKNPFDHFDLFEKKSEAIEFTVNEKKIQLNLIFDEYKKNLFMKDIEIAKTYYFQGKSPQFDNELTLRAESIKNSEIFFRKELYGAYNKNNNIDFSFNEYKKISIKYLAERIKFLLENDLNFILHMKPNKICKGLEEMKNNNYDFVFMFHVIDSLKKDYIAYYDGTYSKINGMFLFVSGSILTGRIYLPQKLINKSDNDYIDGYLRFSIENFIKHYTGVLDILEETGVRIGKSLGDKQDWSDYMANTYQAITNIFIEGSANFAENKGGFQIPFDKKAINKIKEIMITMSKSQNKKVEAFLFNELFNFKLDRYRNVSGPGYIGYFMCYFIGLSFHKSKGKIFSGAHVGDKKITFPYFKEFLNENNNIKFNPLDDETYRITYEAISSVSRKASSSDLNNASGEIFSKPFRTYVGFIKLFEEACKNLDVEPFFTINDLNTLKKNVLEKYQKKKKDSLAGRMNKPNYDKVYYHNFKNKERIRRKDHYEIPNK